ncbi:hypothetical protein ACFV6F_14050 [Kitasatospora phosalacinea]|uniref:hypothetical protein n=1 Tax=Kitasatospora phosalacinea TaxID=2065 RepID=UPI00364C600F
MRPETARPVKRRRRLGLLLTAVVRIPFRTVHEIEQRAPGRRAAGQQVEGRYPPGRQAFGQHPASYD